jgi:hypothetical protein
MLGNRRLASRADSSIQLYLLNLVYRSTCMVFQIRTSRDQSWIFSIKYCGTTCMMGKQSGLAAGRWMLHAASGNFSKTLWDWRNWHFLQFSPIISPWNVLLYTFHAASRLFGAHSAVLQFRFMLFSFDTCWTETCSENFWYYAEVY